MVIERWIVTDILNGSEVFDSEEEAIKKKEEIIEDILLNERDVIIQYIPIKLTGNEILRAHYEMEINSICDDINNIMHPYDDLEDDKLKAYAEEVYDRMMYDDDVHQEYDEALSEHIHNVLRKHGVLK